MEIINHPDYLALWPDSLESPVSVKIIKDHWDTELPKINSLREYFDMIKASGEDQDFGLGPGAKVLMPNGATYTLQYLHPYLTQDDEISFDGDWDYYTNGDRFTFEKIKMALSRALNMVAIHKAAGQEIVDGH